MTTSTHSLNIIRTSRLLWNYLNIYFLKPFDAVNDTLTASLLLNFQWPDEVVEIGPGDGVFSYIMHGGCFPVTFDRYLITSLNKNDIFDTHRKNIIPKVKKIKHPSVSYAFDAKQSHIDKMLEIGYVQKAICAKYENIPLNDNSTDAIFFYTPHDLKDYEKSIQEAYRILKPNGKIFILAYNSDFDDSFICYHNSRKMTGIKAKYFAKLDNGRYDEIIAMSKTDKEWYEFFQNQGFDIINDYHGLSKFAWKVYDIQTRPILKFLIRIFNFFPIIIRTGIKLIWMVCWYPFLLIFYFIFATPYSKKSNYCYKVFELSPISGWQRS